MGMQKLFSNDPHSKEFTLKTKIPKSRLVLPKMKREESYDGRQNQVRKYQSQDMLEETATLERNGTRD